MRLLFSRRRREVGMAEAGRSRLAWRRLLLAVASFLAFFLACFICLWFFFPYPASRLDEYPAGLRVTDRGGRPLRAYASTRGEFRFPVSHREMSPWLLQATVAVEDKHFHSHPGVNPLAIARAAVQNLSRWRVHSGASTLTQQLVRILDERPRTLPAKAVEAFRALQLEAQRTKVELLEAYLNLAPYGGNLRGVEAASLRYFGKSARELSLSEATLLAGLPQSPSRLRPDRHYERALARRKTVIESMVEAGVLSEARAAEVLRDRPVVMRKLWPFRAPHFADLARSRGLALSATAKAPLRTTLDEEAQAICEKHVASFFAAGDPAKASLSAAAVVLEVSSGAVRAMVGSPDFFDLRRRGSINAASRPRSPGSALKPFLYALAFDRGVATPESFLADVPVVFSSYAPENFDRRLLGPVSAAEALSFSLNVPAVRLQRTLGTDAFLSALRRLGLRSLSRSARHYGLTLTLGGGEVSLVDLTAAYAALVRLGEYVPWKVIEGEAEASRDPDLSSDRVLRPGACRLVLEILSSDAHLRQALPSWTGQGQPFLGYKTGTSFGERDAWTVAFTARHVVGVWIGDPRGRGQPGLVGAQTAAGVALAVAAELSRGLPRCPPGEEVLGEIVGDRPVCAVSGFPATAACPRSVRGRFPRGAPPPPPCPIHRKITVDASSGLEVCRACSRGRAVTERVVEVWPLEVEAWLERNGVRRDGAPEGSAMPRHAPGCPAFPEEGKPRILSPAEGEEYLLTEAPYRQDVVLSAAASPGTETLHWFIDGDLVARGSPAREVPWAPSRGSHLIRCVDDRGRVSSVRFRVR